MKNCNVKESDLILARNFVKSEFGIRMRRIRYGGSGALCEEGIIELDIWECKDLETMWSLVFHEVSHVLCYREGLWMKYHDESWGSQKEVANYILRNGLRAERFVDKKAKELMATYFPLMEFVPTYETEEQVKWYRKYILKTYF